MPRYAYDYSVAPARPTGWRSIFASIVSVGAIMAVSAISGVVVTLDLFGPQSTAETSRSVVATTGSVSSQVTHGSSVAPAVARPHAPPRAPSAATKPERPAAPAAVAAALPAPQSSGATVAAAPASPAPVVAPSVAEQAPPAPVAERDLTFSRGYAQRRAARQAAERAASNSAANAKVATGDAQVADAAQSDSQMGRPATKPKPKVATRTQERRYAAQRGDAVGLYNRFDQSDRFDFGRRQALAYGDQRPSRRSPPPSGGLFGGWF